MPILGRTPKTCFDAFARHLRTLVAATLTTRHQIHALVDKLSGTLATLSFRAGRPLAIPLETDTFGRIFVGIGHRVAVETEADGQYRLTTKEYWYRVQNSEDITQQASLRFEYVSHAKRDAYCRYHTQMPAAVSLGKTKLDLNRAHLPTGRVTIEEFIRFLIVDLGVTPPCGDAWPDVLAESERKFFEEFMSRRYKPPGV